MYEALYRKWRPLSFDDVISQPHITKTLSNQIISGKTAHAYLFTGARGTGKTTCARILAKALNCQHSNNGNPCLSCENCVAADNSALTDIIEIDAASNNGVGDVRELRDAAVYLPERCQYKIYIIDEVHMLSISAFNALLKLMEEPPAHVKFILATTEIHKVPSTIISRCQRFDFRRIQLEDIADRLQYISDQEGFTITKDAAFLLARLSEGGMRDAISLLDQCAGYSSDITVDTVNEATGSAGRQCIFDIINGISNHDYSLVLQQIELLYNQSKDISVLCSELITEFRNIMVLQTIPNATDILQCLSEELSELQKFSQAFSTTFVLHTLSLLQECSNKLVNAGNPRMEMELTLMSICSKSGERTSSMVSDATVNSLLNRINQLEQRIASLEQSPTQIRPPAIRKVESSPVVHQNENATDTTDFNKMKISDFKQIQKWPEIIQELSKVIPSVSASLDGSNAFGYQNTMLIQTENPLFLTLFRNAENAKKMSEVIEQVTGIRYTIRTNKAAQKAVSKSPAEMLVQKAKDSQIQTTAL